ncbi:site-specific integrase [Streptomyces sp. NPDC051020]|uniref:site-specific integrase n=1 Tax=Streptomyces sp. NPDC051020 TaxID=3155409 RepID=UPI003430B061
MPLLFQRHVGVENRPIPPSGIRQLLNEALSRTGLTDTVGRPLAFSPHDIRRLFITDAITNGMPPHIAQLVFGHRDINTTMGYKKARELHQTGAKPQVTCSRRRPDGPQRYYELAF